MDFITNEEKKELEEQLRTLIGARKELTERIATARELGDLKENAEYHAAREDQGLNNAKIKDLEERLANSQVTDELDIPEDMVFVGATVKLREVDTGDEDLYKIVGTSSGDFSLDYIEVTSTSPLGEALMKARVGDVVRVDLPKGSTQFEILELA
ncbi:MAG: transcription elongation factor GreA [Planctomycetota bacterium]|nr:transcription elongation factor GreA [Planctomycetota bacterium]